MTRTQVADQILPIPQTAVDDEAKQCIHNLPTIPIYFSYFLSSKPIRIPITVNTTNQSAVRRQQHFAQGVSFTIKKNKTLKCFLSLN